MSNIIDMAGERCGRWTVIRRAERNDGDDRPTWICVCDCGTERVVRGTALRSGKSASCGCVQRETNSKRLKNRRGSEHPAWKGGKFKDPSGGYVMVLRPGHPNGRVTRYVLEHVLVMSQHLGRPLRKGETVHHKNGIRDDNRIQNLELWSSSHPAGQRVSDKIAWAKDFIRQYEDAGKTTFAFLLSRPAHETRVGM